MTPQTRAEKSAAAMWATDKASQHLSMRIDNIAPGAATLSMPVTASMLTAIIHEAPVLARGAMFEGPLLLDAHR